MRRFQLTKFSVYFEKTRFQAKHFSFSDFSHFARIFLANRPKFFEHEVVSTIPEKAKLKFPKNIFSELKVSSRQS